MAIGARLDSGVLKGAVSKTAKLLAVIISLLPAVTALLISMVLIMNSELAFTSLTDRQTLDSLALLALFCLAGLAVGYGVRYLLPADGPAPPSVPAASSDHHRDRLARYVVTAGMVGIFATALTIIIAIAVKSPSGDTSWKESVLAIFTSVLPVFATWVGTVLAFYFTNETVRRTQQSQAQATGIDGEPITRAGTMIPFDSVARIELDDSAVVANGSAAAAGATIELAEIQDLFGPTGVSRVVIFDDKKAPVFVIQRSAMPPVLAANETVEDYLETGTNRDSAVKFTIVSASTTVAEARRRLEAGGFSDLFVTEHGSSQEPTLGWVPDENLRRT